MFHVKIQTLMEKLFGTVVSVKKRTKILQFTLFLPTSNIVLQKMVCYLLIKESTKIVPPIILFLIDISGSMTSSIYTDILGKSQHQNEKKTSLITNQIKKII